MKALSLIVVLVAVAGCTSLTPADDPVYLRLTDVEARLIRIERVVENESLIELAGEIAQLRTETQALRGEIETLRFSTESAADRQRDLYVDLDSRLQALEEAPAAVPVASAPGATGVPVLAAAINDQQAYDAAFAMVQGRQYEGAASAFTSFLVTYPTSVLRDNAQYWLAETHYVRREFATALAEFQRVLDEYPQSAKLPDALLKVGYCNYELDRFDEARQALQQVSRLYPDTTAARLAEQRLDRIAQEAG